MLTDAAKGVAYQGRPFRGLTCATKTCHIGRNHSLKMGSCRVLSAAVVSPHEQTTVHYARAPNKVNFNHSSRCFAGCRVSLPGLQSGVVPVALLDSGGHIVVVTPLLVLPEDSAEEVRMQSFTHYFLNLKSSSKCYTLCLHFGLSMPTPTPLSPFMKGIPLLLLAPIKQELHASADNTGEAMLGNLFPYKG